MRKTAQEFRIGTGASSILLVLVVLCLTVLGILAYSAARADNALTERNTEATERYYAAVAEAEERLCALASEGKAGTFAFQISVGEGLALDVRGALENGVILRERFALVNTAEWQPEDDRRLYAVEQEQ